MNKEELKELAATLNGIADGKAWERTNSITGEWCDPDHWDPEKCLWMGRKIRLKPWSLPPPPEGMQWHREDGWTEEMLEGGWRPQCLGEYGNEYEHSSDGAQWEEVTCKASIMAVTPNDANGFYRTKRPLPQPDPYAELKAAHAAGKKLQHRCPSESKWSDCSVTDTTQAPYCFVFEPECYRIKPDQQKVALGPDDVPPGSWISLDREHLAAVIAVSPSSLSTADTTRSWKRLMDDAIQINRSIPITGKWNPEAWEPCYKLIDTP